MLHVLLDKLLRPGWSGEVSFLISLGADVYVSKSGSLIANGSRLRRTLGSPPVSSALIGQSLLVLASHWSLLCSPYSPCAPEVCGAGPGDGSGPWLLLPLSQSRIAQDLKSTSLHF